MAKKRTKTTPESINRRKKAGRGEGSGIKFNPYTVVQDLHSRGRKSRVWGALIKRIHHVLSDLELTVLLMIQLSPYVVDIQEQWDLPLERTLAIAEKLGLDHPIDPETGYYPPITTDFLITTDDGLRRTTWARTVKSSKELDDMRVLEKFEIERTYFAGNNIDWGIITEKQLPEQLRINVEHLRAYLVLDRHNIDEQVVWQSVDFLTPKVYEGMHLQAMARLWEDEFEGVLGDGITAIKFLIINSAWPVDLKQKIRPNAPIPLIVQTDLSSETLDDLTEGVEDVN